METLASPTDNNHFSLTSPVAFWLFPCYLHSHQCLGYRFYPWYPWEDGKILCLTSVKAFTKYKCDLLLLILSCFHVNYSCGNQEFTLYSLSQKIKKEKKEKKQIYLKRSWRIFHQRAGNEEQKGESFTSGGCVSPHTLKKGTYSKINGNL